MAIMKSSGDLLASIGSDLANNNAGEISAEDVRHNMEDTVYSINRIIASGDTDIKYPFYNNVRIKHTEGVGGGRIIAESGIIFPNGPLNTTLLQKEPYPGAGQISHNDLDDLTEGDPHTQYVAISGVKAGRAMTGNLAVGNNWINASGNDSMGIKFAPNADATEDILVSGDFTFGDDSKINTGHAVAKAWLNFDGSGVGNVPVVNSYYNIDQLERLDTGKFRITFTSGVFLNNYYTAVATSNSTTASGSKEDFDVNTVGLVLRQGNDTSALRTLTYVIQNKAGQYVDSQINDLVCFGYGPLTSSGTTPTVVGL